MTKNQIKEVKIFFLIFILSCSLAYYLLGDNLNSKFSIIDDHQVIENIEKSNQFNFSSLWNKFINDDELNSITGRYRPSWQFMHLVEIHLFGDNVFYYYLLRLIVFSFFISIIAYLLYGKVGAIYGSLISIIVLSEIYWHDIFSRIIVSEVHVILGLVFFIPSSFYIYNFIKSRIKSNPYTLLCFALIFLLSGMYISGSKENFIFISLIPIFILFQAYKKNNKNLLIWVPSLSLVIFSIWIFIRTILFFLLDLFPYEDQGNVKSGFGNFSYEGALHIFDSLINILFYNWYAIYLFIPHIIILFLGFSKYKSINLKKITLENLYLNFLLIVLLVLQIAFYSGSTIPSDTRYDFPSSIFFIIYLSSIILYYKKIFVLTNAWNLMSKSFLAFIIIFFIYQKSPLSTLQDIQISGLNHKQNTIQFNDFLNDLKIISEKNPEFPIVVNSFNVWDYELISSLFKFIKYFEIKNKISLKLHYGESDYATEVEKIFVKRLESVSKNDSYWKPQNYKNEWGYDSFEVNNSEYKCISINIRYNVDESNCLVKSELKFNGR